jgi:hypothetical protein
MIDSAATCVFEARKAKLGKDAGRSPCFRMGEPEDADSAQVFRVSRRAWIVESVI